MPPLSSSSLTLYFSSAPSTTLPSAELLYTSAGAPTIAVVNNSVGTALRWGELCAKATPTWAAAAALPAPTGNGTLLDSALLVGTTLASGSWQATIRLSLNGGSTAITADLRLRAFKRSSGGVYSSIVDLSLPAQTITTTSTTFTFPSTAGIAMAFSSGEKLYSDLWANIVASTNSASLTIKWGQLSADTATHTGNTLAMLSAPAYGMTQTALLKDTAARLRLLMGTTPSIAARLVLRIANTMFCQIAARVLVRATPRGHIRTRLIVLFSNPGTPLTLFGLRRQAFASNQANRLALTSGGVALSSTLQLGTRLGSAEITSQGSTASWAALSTLPAPTGNGWFLEAPTSPLQNQQILAGTWSSAVTLNTTGGTVIADLTLRVYVYTLFGLYVPVISTTLPASRITSTMTSYLIGSAGRTELQLYDQEKLYLDVWATVTQSIGTTDATLLVTTLEGTATTAAAAQATIGAGAGSALVVPYTGLSLLPPNYRPLPGGNLTTRFLLKLLTVAVDIGTRLTLTDPAQNDTYARLVLLAVGKNDVTARLLLRLLTSIAALNTRLALTSPPKRGVPTRLLLQLLSNVLSVAGRVRLTTAPRGDIAARLGLLLHTVLSSLAGRVRLAIPPRQDIGARLDLQ